MSELEAERDPSSADDAVLGVAEAEATIDAAGSRFSGLRERAPSSLSLLSTEGVIERIVEQEQPVLRNLLITQSYHELSRQLAEVVDTANVNWSTFATWASKTAGRSIRNEEVPAFFLEVLDLERRIAAHLPGWLHNLFEKFGALWRIKDAAVLTLAEVSAQVAEGNLKVYAELGPVFQAFIQMMRGGFSSQALAEFSATLRPGPPDQDGQDLLRAAFADYAAAAQSVSQKQRAELMLLANCRIGLHEQTRLQPNIEGAIDAPIDNIFLKHLRATLPVVLRWPFAAVLKHLVRHFTRELTVAWQELATRYAMNLALPDGKEIPLGADVPALPSGAPALLQSFENHELGSLFLKYRGAASSNEGSAANNWARLDDRMGFIVELFRCRQQELDLFEAPFSSPQQEELARGEVPAGAL